MSIDDIKPRAIATLYRVEELNIAERVILDLAAKFQRRADRHAVVISYPMQTLAANVFAQLGLEECLRMLAEED